MKDVGYPSWHPKFKGNSSTRAPNRSNSRFGNSNLGHNKNQFSGSRMAASAQSNVAPVPSSGFTPQQLEQIAKLIPQLQSCNLKGWDTEDELDCYFSGMISCNQVIVNTNEWIIDSGASDHMTPHLCNLIKPSPMARIAAIHLPNGDTAPMILLLTLFCVFHFLNIISYLFRNSLKTITAMFKFSLLIALLLIV